MQEWIDTLRLKLREMKILSPNENLYSKLPEVRPPLLPTRDPMSPLPATPPVPAAIVPGVERVITNTSQSARQVPSSSTPAESIADSSEITPSIQLAASTSNEATASTSSIPSTSMSNTLTQNLIKMLSDPVSTYNDQVNSTYGTDSEASFNASTSNDTDEIVSPNELPEPSANRVTAKVKKVPSLATTFVNNVLADPNTCGASTSGLSSYVSTLKRETRPNENDNETSSLDSITSSVCPTPEPIVIPRYCDFVIFLFLVIPLMHLIMNFRPQTIRKETAIAIENKNIECEASENDDDGGTTTNITIIQVSSPITKDKFKFDEPIECEDDKYKSNVQIIPSNFTENVQSQNDDETSKSIVTTVQLTSAVINVTASAAIDLSETAPRSITAIANSIVPLTSTAHVTNVPVGIADTPAVRSPPVGQQHYEQVFVMASSIPANNNQNDVTATPMSPRINVVQKQQKSASQTEIHVNRIKLHKTDTAHTSNIQPSTSTASVVSLPPPAATSSIANANKSKIQIEPKRRPLLTRGLTEAVILRSSRKDQPNRLNFKEPTSTNIGSTSAVQSLRNESSEQRKRSSSTSDTQGVRNRSSAAASNNNAASNINTNNATNINNNNNNVGPELRRVQAPPQPIRPSHVELSLHASGRLTMREQQVMQLRREMMHPGGVRLQLRRKDCINSIGFVDAFGAVW